MKTTPRHQVALAVGLAVLCAAFVAEAKAKHFAPWDPPVNLEQVPGTHPDVNTAFNDGCPMQSPDGRSLYMASNRSPGGLGGQDIWVAHRTGKQGPFGAPENLGSPVNSSADDFCPTPLRGNWLLFVSARDGGCGGPDIYLTRWSRLGWRAPLNLGCQVNSVAGEAGPSLVKTGAGAMLFFSSTRAGGFSADGPTPPFDSDIYASRRLPDGSFGPAQLVPGLNTTADDSRPNVRRDGLELVFDSNRPAGAPGAPTNDLYSATRAKATAAWSAPTFLDTLSSTANDTRASFSGDARTLYFGSNRPGSEGQADIYVATRQTTAPKWSAASPLVSAGERADLLAHLAAISRPLRAAVLRAHLVSSATNGAIFPGDPPFLRQIAARCTRLRALDLAARLAAEEAPRGLQAVERRMGRAYSAIRVGCVTARRVARAAFASGADRATREQLKRFLPILRSFSASVHAWRASVLAQSTTLGVGVPAWVRDLR
jgi:WD40-like Beta Propeller Repeat